jgi:hypothetical protein
VREDGFVQPCRRCAAGQVHARLPDLAENHALSNAGLREAAVRRNEHEHQKSAAELRQHKVRRKRNSGRLAVGNRFETQEALIAQAAKCSREIICNLIFSRAERAVPESVKDQSSEVSNQLKFSFFFSLIDFSFRHQNAARN